MNLKKYYKYSSIICALLIILILFILFKSDLSANKKEKTTEPSLELSKVNNITLITNKDCSETKTNQICQALEHICKEFDKSYAIFDVSSYDNSYEQTISAATVSGASLIICPDASFAEAIYNLQTSYINVYFLIIDGVPHNADNSDTTINYNVIPLMFDEAEIGFFAGYALAFDGYKDISFIGLEDSLSSQYFYGLLNGINYASQTLNINDVSVCYGYASEDNYDTVISRMFSSDNEVIVASGDSIIDETIAQAEKQHTPCIICSDNYSIDSDIVLATASKNISTTLYDCLYNLYSNNITGGKGIKYSAANNSIGLSFNNNSFKRFDSNVYDRIYQELAEDKISIISDTAISPEELELDNIKSIKKIIE